MVDRFGRTVAEVLGEINLGLAMVEGGTLDRDFCHLSPQLLPVVRIYHPQLFKASCLHCPHHTLKLV
jgi:hypothetical protein